MADSEHIDALLIRPWIEDFSAFDLWMRPLGLLRLATILRRLDISVDLLDCLDRQSPHLEGLPSPPSHRLDHFGCGHLYREDIQKPEVISFVPRRFKRYGIPLERIEQELQRRSRPDVIFISCMATYWYSGAQRMVSLVKSIWPDAHVIIGGIYALLCPSHAHEVIGADGIVSERGWSAAIELAAPHLGSPSTAAIQKACSEPIEPAYDLMTSRQTIPILTRAGCPYRCTYCASEHIYPDCISFPPEWVAAQIAETVSHSQPSDLTFFDDALLLHPDRHIKPLLEAIIRLEIPLRFHTPNALHVRYIDSELSDLMKRAGVMTIRLGLESGDPEFMASSGGKVKLDEYDRAMEHLKKAGYTAREVGTYILSGMPNQPLEDMRRSAEYAHRRGGQVKLALYSPTPKTEMFKNRESFIFDPSIDPILQNDSLTPWRSELYTADEFQNFKLEVDRLNDFARRGLQAC